MKTAVCQVCGARRPMDEIDTYTQDVGLRFGIIAHVYFMVDYCAHHRVCFETAAARAHAFSAGDDVGAVTATAGPEVSHAP